MIVLDTNIVIYYLQGNSDIVNWLERELKNDSHIALSALSVVELLGFPKITADEQFLINQLFRTILIVDVDFSIAREAARIRREQKLKTIDSVIAATAVILHAPLVSRDMVFKHIRDIEVIVP